MTRFGHSSMRIFRLTKLGLSVGLSYFYPRMYWKTLTAAKPISSIYSLSWDQIEFLKWTRVVASENSRPSSLPGGVVRVGSEERRLFSQAMVQQFFKPSFCHSSSRRHSCPSPLRCFRVLFLPEFLKYLFRNFPLSLPVCMYFHIPGHVSFLTIW